MADTDTLWVRKDTRERLVSDVNHGHADTLDDAVRMALGMPRTAERGTSTGFADDPTGVDGLYPITVRSNTYQSVKARSGDATADEFLRAKLGLPTRDDDREHAIDWSLD